MTASIVKSFMRIAALFFVAAAPAALARDCEMPDEGGAPLRRAVARVKYLPEIETWAELMSRSRTVVQYVLSLDEPRSIGGRCYWPVEVRADGRLWKRFLVTPDGARVIEDAMR
ncbi:MAG: hypothetical protein ACREUO_12230 [Burkholderiales bacterium]